jgi:4-amino-4-deoxy-L-arabinose transferase-like glycosyltransferase
MLTATRAPPPALARRPVFSAMVALGVVLAILSNEYGYHRDELYFRMLKPGWGYVDQPPLTPLIVHFVSQVADSPWAVRVPATLATMGAVLAVALLARELGGSARAQGITAWGFAFAAIPLVMGHLMLTTSIDFAVWPLVVLFVVRAQLRDDPRWWLVAGVVVGLSMYNKLLLGMLVVSIAGGVALVGPRRLFRSRWVLQSAVLALLVGSPNLVYQAANHWPQLTMGRALADNNGGQVRVQMWPFLLILLGPPLVPIWLKGLVALWRRPDWRPVRFLTPAFLVLLALVFVAGTQFYYPVGLMSALYAAGCVDLVDSPARPRWRSMVAAVAANSVVSALIALPLVPVTALGDTPIPGINQSAGDQVGWPTYVRQVAAVYRKVPAAERGHTIVITSNYGEAGAIARFGPSLGLPAVYSGQNQLYFQARPPDAASVVVFVGGGYDTAVSSFARCRVQGRLDNDVGVDNEEQAEPIAICRDPAASWAVLWPRFQHYD